MGILLFVLVSALLGVVAWLILTELRKNGLRVEQQNYMLAQLIGVRQMPQPEPEPEPQTWQMLGPQPQVIPQPQQQPTVEQQAAFFARRG